MIAAKFDEIRLEHIDALIKEEIPESRTLEYKREIPSGSPKLITTVASFANSDGGDLLIGIEEKGGIPIAVYGQKIDSIDSEILRIQQSISSGTEPRVPHVSIKAIEVESGRHVILVRTLPSPFGPHRILTKSNKDFYKREFGKNSPMDINEIRAAILKNEAAREKIRSFRADRIELLRKPFLPYTNIRFATGPLVTLHVIPISTSIDQTNISLREHADICKTLRPPISSASNYGFNLDGYLTYYIRSDGNRDACQSHLQVFVNGAVEAAFVCRSKTNKQIPSQFLISVTIEKLRDVVEFYKSVSIPGPFVFSMALLYSGGHRLIDKTIMFSPDDPVLDRTHALLPDAEIPFGCQSLENEVRGVFDALFNAFGYERCPYYDARTGLWNAKFLKSLP